MYQLAVITVVIFVLGFCSAAARIAQVGGAALPVSTKVEMGLFGLLCAYVGAYFIFTSNSLLSLVIAEFFVLCFGQTVGYILSGKKQK